MQTLSNGRRSSLPAFGVLALLVLSSMFAISLVPAARATTPGPILYPECGGGSIYSFFGSAPTTPASCGASSSEFEEALNLDGVSEGVVYVNLYLASSDLSTTFSPVAVLLNWETSSGGQNIEGLLAPTQFSASDGGSCADPLQVELILTGGANTFPTTTEVSLSVSGFSSAVQFCTGYQGAVSFVDFGEPITQTAVSCFPGEMAAYSVTTCTASVTGSGSPTGTVDFSSSTSTGAFNPSDGACTLSSGTCSVQYTDGPGQPIVYGTYTGDSTHVASAGTADLLVASSSGGGGSTVTVTSTATSTSSTTVTSTAVSSTTVTSTSVSTSTVTGTTTVATEGTLETTILNNEGTFNPGDTIASLLYGLGTAVSSVESSLSTLSATVNADFSNIGSSLATLTSGVNGLTTTVTTDFAGVTSSLTGIQSSLSSITTTLNGIQSEINTLSTAQSHSALTGSASGETVLSSSYYATIIYTTANDKVAIVGVSVNATQTSGHGFVQSGPLQIRFYTDPSHPNVYVQQTVSIYDFGQGGQNAGDGYVGTGAAWKVALVATFPAHSTDATITANWAVSSSGPP